MIDKLTVDQCIALVNMALGASLGEATPRERKYLYDLIEILRQEHFEECQDVGLSVQELAYKLVEHWLADEYYGALIRTEKTILIIHNRRSRDAVTLLNELREEAAWIDDREYAEQEREQQVGLKISRLKERMFAIGT